MTLKRYSIAIRTLLIAGLLGVSCVKDAPDTPEDPGVVRMEGALGYEVIDAQGDGDVLARIHIGTEDVSGMRRPPLNLALVLDTSGSMMGDPIERVKEAAREIVGTLRDDDHLSVVTFHSGVDVVLANTEVDDVDMDELREAIDAIEASGTTQLAPGLATGIQQIAAWNGEGNELRRIVLLGDGVPNSPTAVLPQAARAAQMHTPITTLGLGLEYDEVLMGQIAQTSGGTFTYVEEADAVLAVFRREVTRLEQTLARGMQLRLSPGPGVELLEVVGHQTPTNGGAVALNLGDLSAGQEWSIVVKMSAPERRAGALVELLDAKLTFTDAFTDAGALERDVFLGARASEDASAIEASRNDSVHRAAAEVEAAAEVLAAIQMVRQGDPNAAVTFENAARIYEDAGPEYRNRAESVRRTSTAASAEDAPAAARALNREHEAAMDSVGY